MKNTIEDTTFIFISADGTVDYYLPEGTWTSVISGETVTGSRWVREEHDYLSLPLLARPDSVIPWGARNDVPDYDYGDNVTLRCYELVDGHVSTVSVPAPGGASVTTFEVRRDGSTVSATSSSAAPWSLAIGQATPVAAVQGSVSVSVTA